MIPKSTDFGILTTQPFLLVFQDVDPYNKTIVNCAVRCFMLSALKKFSGVHSAIREILGLDPRWQLGCRSRQLELCKSKILLRHWSCTWQK
jgi:hypothetical protein